MKTLLACLTLATGAAFAQPAPNVAHFDLYADGDAVHLLVGTGRKGDGAIVLWHLRSSDGGANWSAPVRVTRDADRISARHPGENPQIVADGARVITAWTAPRPSGGRGGIIRLAQSDDGGRTWSAGNAPFENPNGSQTFMELAAAGGELHMAWLDSRTGNQSLRYARAAGAPLKWSGDEQLAARTCECCWNSIAASGANVAVLYRGATPRDMMLASRNGSERWRDWGSIGQFGWRINACPHTGGGLALQGNAVHALVWTGKDDLTGLYYFGSPDGGASWPRSRRLGTVDAQHADLVIAADSRLVAVWDEAGVRSSAIHQSESTDGGVSWSAPKALSRAGAMASFPRIVATRSGTVTAWLDGNIYERATLMVNGRAVPLER